MRSKIINNDGLYLLPFAAMMGRRKTDKHTDRASDARVVPRYVSFVRVCLSYVNAFLVYVHEYVPTNLILEFGVGVSSGV